MIWILTIVAIAQSLAIVWLALLLARYVKKDPNCAPAYGSGVGSVRKVKDSNKTWDDNRKDVHRRAMREAWARRKAARQNGDADAPKTE